MARPVSISIKEKYPIVLELVRSGISITKAIKEVGYHPSTFKNRATPKQLLELNKASQRYIEVRRMDFGDNIYNKAGKYWATHRCTVIELSEEFDIGYGHANNIIKRTIDFIKKVYSPEIDINISSEYGPESEIRHIDHTWNPERDVDWSNYASPNKIPLTLF